MTILVIGQINVFLIMKKSGLIRTYAQRHAQHNVILMRYGVKESPIGMVVILLRHVSRVIKKIYTVKIVQRIVQPIVSNLTWYAPVTPMKMAVKHPKFVYHLFR